MRMQVSALGEVGGEAERPEQDGEQQGPEIRDGGEYGQDGGDENKRGEEARFDGRSSPDCRRFILW